MSWLLSILVAILTALTAAVVTGVVASLAVDWYHVPSREGASGYFVLGFILLAIICGFIIGMILSRIVAAQPNPGFLKAFGYSQLTVLSIAGIVGIVCRLVADVGPTLGGESLLLNVEYRWPKGVKPPAPTEQWWLQLASVSNHVQRGSQRGPMWPEDAREEDGYWIMPGAVDVWTSRGDRVIDLKPDSILPTGYVIPLAAWPRRKYLDWSPWYPVQRKNGPPLPDEFRFRFRIVQGNHPIRSQKIGPFDIATIASSVGEVTYSGSPATWYANASFKISYRGQPVTIEGKASDADTAGRWELIDGVAVLPGAEPALLVMVNGNRGTGDVWLVAPEGDTLRTERIAYSSGWSLTPPLTNDTAVFSAAANSRAIDGRVETNAFVGSNLYLFKGAVLDARTRTVHRIKEEEVYNLVDRINPLAVSPDEKSFVRLGYDPDSSNIQTFEVFSLTGADRYRLPADKYQLRFGEIDDLSPLFVSHYFSWTKGADGTDHLVPRANVKPLPYRGRLSMSDPTYSEYRLYLAKQSLRPAFIAWLVTEFKAEHATLDEAEFSQDLTIDGKPVHVSWSKDDGHVGLWMDRDTDVSLVGVIGERFNVALLTGKYDQYFYAKEPAPAGVADSTSANP